MEMNAIKQPYLDLTSVQRKQEKVNQEDYTKVQNTETNNKNKTNENSNLSETLKTMNVEKKEETVKIENKQEKVISENEQIQNTQAAKQTYQQSMVANTLSLSGETSKLMSSINNLKNM